MKPTVIASAISLFVTGTVFAATPWNEAAIVKAVGQKAITKQKEQDSGDGCMVTRYFFRKSPDMALEFRCNRVNVAWEQFRDAGFEQKNKEATQLAQRAAAALSGGVGNEVIQAGQGVVFKRHPVPSGLAVNGSCVLPTCLLTYK